MDDTAIWLGLCVATLLAVGVTVGYIAMHQPAKNEEEVSQETTEKVSGISGNAVYDPRFIRSDLDGDVP